MYAPIKVITSTDCVSTTAVDAAVSLPYASTVIDAGVYVPAVTAVVTKSIVGSAVVPPTIILVVFPEVTV